MNVERNLPVIRERKLAILKGDPELCAQQKKAGKLLARERIAQLLDAASFVELDVLNADAGVVTGYGLIEGSPVYVYAQDFTVKGGSVGVAHARLLLGGIVDAIAGDAVDVIGIHCLGNGIRIGVDKSDVVVLLGQVTGQIQADLAGTDDNNSHNLSLSVP